MWCRNCVDLLINIAYQPAPIITTETDDAEFLEEDDFDDGDDFFGDYDEDVDVNKPNDDEDHQDRIRRVYVDLLPHFLDQIIEKWLLVQQRI